MRPMIWRWKAPEGTSENPWQYREVMVHPDNIHLVELVEVFTEEEIKQVREVVRASERERCKEACLGVGDNYFHGSEGSDVVCDCISAINALGD